MPKDTEPSSLSGANRILADALRYYAGRRPMSNPKGWGHVLRRYEAARHSIFEDVSDAQWDEALEILRLLAEEHPDPIGGPRTVREEQGHRFAGVQSPDHAAYEEIVDRKSRALQASIDEAAAAAAIYEAERHLRRSGPPWAYLPEGLVARYVRGAEVMLPVLQSGGTRMEAAKAQYEATRGPEDTGTWNTLDSVSKDAYLAAATALEMHLYDTALAAAEVPSEADEALAETATRTVTLLQEGRLPEFFSGVGALAEHAPEAVLLELTRQVLAAADGADLKALTAATLMPDPDIARTIVAAVRADDWDRLRSVVATGYPNLVTALLATTAALKETTS